jgi:hypothetical protein
MLIGAIGHIVERQIWNSGQYPRKLLVGSLRSQLHLRHRGLELGHLRHQRGGAGVILCLLGITDFPGGGVTPRLRLLRFEDRRAALLVDRKQRGGHRRESTPFQSGIEEVRIVADPFDVVHG